MLLLDQQQTTVSSTSGFLDGTFGFAQTFTVGRSGRLDGITINVANSGLPVTLNLLQVTSGVPTFTVLASAVAIGPASPTFTFFDFLSSDIHVHVGEVLAFSPSVTTSNGQVIGTDLPGGGVDPYSGGDLFYTDPGIGVTTWEPFATYPLSDFSTIGLTHTDAAFETFVAVPEPVTFALFGVGLLIMGLLTQTSRPSLTPSRHLWLQLWWNVKWVKVARDSASLPHPPSTTTRWTPRSRLQGSSER